MRPKPRLAVLLLVLASGAALTGQQHDDRLSPRSQAAAKAREKRIKSELAQLPGHEWAGDYFYGDGKGTNVSLLFAPRSGFVFSWHGCLGLYDLNYGDVTAYGGRLKLLFEHPNRREGFEGIAPELTPVLWGDRHYLIPSDEMVEFTNRINAGFEPREGMFGSFLLRRGDEKKEAHGDPSMPAEYRSYLLAAPITARISSIGKSHIENCTGCDWKRRVTPVTLDAGSLRGVKVGMEFYVRNPPNHFQSVRVTKIEESASESELAQDLEDKPPSMDWELSTSALVGK